MATVPASATIASTGIGLRYIGTSPMHSFAYSGVIALPSSSESYLEFTSGTGYILGSVEISADWSGLGGNEIYIQFFLNGEAIIFERDTGNNYVGGNLEFPLLIPPFTFVQVKLHSSVAQEASATFTGRVYDA